MNTISSAAPIGDSASIITTTANDPAKKLWCETQWTTLSWQAKALGLPKLPFFDPKTMLLSKQVNKKLWRQLGRLYNKLGADRAPYATPVMLEGGEVEWHSYLDSAKGDKAEIYDED